jgi:hypothetical protein
VEIRPRRSQNRPLASTAADKNGEMKCNRSVKHNSEKKQALSGKDALLGVPIPTSRIAAIPAEKAIFDRFRL